MSIINKGWCSKYVFSLKHITYYHTIIIITAIIAFAENVMQLNNLVSSLLVTHYYPWALPFIWVEWFKLKEILTTKTLTAGDAWNNIHTVEAHTRSKSLLGL